MEPLKIKPTPTSLEIILDAEAGKLSFSGRSIPEHGMDFFQPVIDWLNAYAQSSDTKETECAFKFEYFNSASRKCLIEIFKILLAIHRKGCPVKIVWEYEEDDAGMKEMGEEYEALFNLKFRFVPY
ncbi:MAG: DUF1987 domain-containing protein [Bacteroidetes bacterium]|nr:DUF1987 domain-containing protein [Bacteroidota bacterium]